MFKLTNIHEKARVNVTGLLRSGDNISLANAESVDLAQKDIVPTYKQVMNSFKGFATLTEVSDSQEPIVDLAKGAAEKLAAEQAEKDAKDLADKLAKEAQDKIAADELKVATQLAAELAEQAAKEQADKDAEAKQLAEEAAEAEKVEKERKELEELEAATAPDTK